MKRLSPGASGFCTPAFKMWGAEPEVPGNNMKKSQKQKRKELGKKLSALVRELDLEVVAVLPPNGSHSLKPVRYDLH